jgi:hypothetical protein
MGTPGMPPLSESVCVRSGCGDLVVSLARTRHVVRTHFFGGRISGGPTSAKHLMHSQGRLSIEKLFSLLIQESQALTCRATNEQGSAEGLAGSEFPFQEWHILLG